ncbi:protein CLEC16A [Entomortierella parvispora]|uniref:Protein CLEC16A n=1 Tax=Entomortierella parvispora TaxID=205924 RepID=A0A9P3H3G4_9FUNG|nr:protein CLEC16A [Entomortierella parvispora]
MFENVRSQESLYFLLSNNYVNQVIGVRYDFSNDEILAYYIYLLRTLSFKLSKDTIYFFFNEHLDDFPLYSEAIKFFNHEESMIRIAVRVITLNVYSVDDKQMQEFILDRTTTTYFSNLVWFIGNYGTTVNDMLLHPGEGEFSRMNYYLAEHMDCFYYVNDIIELEVPKINKILISHLLNRLLRPMYLDSILPPNATKSGSGSGSGTKSSSSSQKLVPLVALSLMLHAFHVLKHAPLVSALTSTLFSNQLYSNNSPAHQPNTRQGPSPLSLGPSPSSPDTSRPSSPVTSKFYSFGLLGSSPGLDSTILSVHSPTPQARINHHHHPLAPAQNLNSSDNQQQNPYKTAIFEYLSMIDSDRLVLPALTLIYLTGRNPGVMQDVLLGTDIYPQRLLKTRLLMGNLMSSTSPSKGVLGATPMSRERSADSIVSNQSLGSSSTSTWLSSPGQNLPTSITGSLFGPAGSAARMRSRTESPLFETEEDDQESRETEELLASETSRHASPPSSSSKTILSTSLPTASGFPARGSLSRNLSADGEAIRQSKSKSHRRRGSKASSILAPLLPSTGDDSLKSKGAEESTQIEQELKPVSTSKADRGLIDNYPSTDEEDHDYRSKATSRKESELDSDVPPPLPPRPAPETITTELETIPESTKIIRPEFVVQNREELIGRLFDILCGRPESGAHRFRMCTIQMAAELLIEFVATKVGPAKDNKDQSNGNIIHNSGVSSSSSMSAVDNQLGEARLNRLALAEAQFRGRVQKGIRKLEKMKMRQGGGVGGHGINLKQPLGLLTGRVERALSESSLGIERQIVNIISESSIIYGPDRDLDKELDLDPTQELIALFDLDPEYTDMSHEKLERLHEQEKTQKDYEDSTPPTSSGSTNASGRERRRTRMRTKIKSKMQGATAFSGDKSAADFSTTSARSVTGGGSGGHSMPTPAKPSMELRLEAMVIRYVKWLHLLIQCHQLLCRKAGNPATGLVGSPLPPAVTATSVSAKPGTVAVNLGSSTFSINGPLISTPFERRPSDLLAGSAGAVVSAHKGLQKALATTATTTTTAGPLGPKANASLPTVEVEGPLTAVSSTSSPSTTVNSAVSSASPSMSSSTSSLSSMTSSPVPNAVASGTFSQSGSASGSRTLLTATAALEAASAAHNQQHQEGVSGASNGGSGSTSINEMLSLHLDPLSASMSEAFRKSSARIKKSVVDPLAAANPLFRTSSSNSTTTSASLSVNDAVAHKGFYRPPSAVSSAASSVVSLNKPSEPVLMGADGERMATPMQRSGSNSSTSASHSGGGGAGAPTKSGGATTASVQSVGGGSISNARTSEDQTTLRDDVLETTHLSKKKMDGHEDEQEEGEEEEVPGFKSILDPGYPTYDTDESVQKILATLGLL